MGPRDPLAPLLERDGVIVLDGGLATQLEAQGSDLSDELWSARLLLDDPAQIVAAHLAYFRAGARVATTASYQASFAGFARRGIDGAAAAGLLRHSVRLALEARDRYRAERAPDDPGSLLVAASIGPFGATLADGSEYRGRYGLAPAALRDVHRRRLEVLVGTDADLLACETIPELEEAEALVSLLEETAGAVAWMSFTCRDGARLRSGAPFEEAVEVAVGSDRVVAVGVNCTAPEHVDELVARARSVSNRPVVVYPNSGEGWDPATRRWTGARGARIDLDATRRWLRAGVSLIGGCCRVGPSEISTIAGVVSART